MASYSVAKAKHATLAAGVVDTVTVSQGVAVEILNRSDAEIYAAAVDVTPTVAGDNCWLVPARTSLTVPLFSEAGRGVRLISTAAAAYSVTAVPTS